jgi:hypothetical protein
MTQLLLQPGVPYASSLKQNTKHLFAFLFGLLQKTNHQ